MHCGIDVGLGLRSLGGVSVLAISSVAADAALGMPIGKNGLPSTFAGEALTVALAFAFPALMAGAFLALRGLWRGFGLRRALVVGTVVIACGCAAALVELRPDLLTIAGWTQLAAPQ